MRCPSCQYNGTKVIDSRPVDDNKAIRRRRECESCGFRYTTFEKVEEMPLVVVKKTARVKNLVVKKCCAGLFVPVKKTSCIK